MNDLYKKLLGLENFDEINRMAEIDQSFVRYMLEDSDDLGRAMAERVKDLFCHLRSISSL